jgi:cell wall assembly regulator SMI1
MVSVQESWQALKDWFAENHPKEVDQLNPGALPYKFRSLEALIPNLPQEFYDLYRLNDGQEYEPSRAGILLGLQMLSIYEIERDYNIWKELIESDPDYGDEEGLSYPPGHIKTDYINLGRIPITGDSGNHLGIDLDPGPLGKVGQIISYGADEHDKYVIASSLGEFLEFVLKCYQTGRAVVETSAEGESRIVWTNPRAKFFFTVLPHLFAKQTLK